MVARCWDLWTQRFASWMFFMLGLLFASGLCCTCFSSGLLSNYSFNCLPRIFGYFLKAQLEWFCQPGIFQPARLKKELLLFGSWGYCLQCSMGLLHISVLVLAGGVHGVTAFDMGLLPLTWGYYFSHEATSCLT